MNARLMYPDRAFDAHQPLAWNASALAEDLSLRILVSTMAGDDPLIEQVTQAVLLVAAPLDRSAVMHRQAIVRDAVEQSATVRALYEITDQAVENRRRSWFGITSRYPSSMLSGAVELMSRHVPVLERLRDIARSAAPRFRSPGFLTLFATLESELSEDYLLRVRQHLETLRLRYGVPLSARLGPGNAGADYRLLEPDPDTRSWLRRLFSRGPEEYVYRLPERDEAGARALSELHDRGIQRVARAMVQATDHVDGFLHMLRMELAFHLGCINLWKRLTALKVPLCYPELTPRRPLPSGRGLEDPCLALQMGQSLVTNELKIGGESLLVITGANQGGKSTLLRAIGLAQLMAQSGMFVAAEELEMGSHPVITHFKREEDPELKRGKFDEELARMSLLTDHLSPENLVLFNESFAATNEREGSAIARQIVMTLLEHGITVAFVTHLHTFAREMYESLHDRAVFLRAERLPDGRRTFRLLPNKPLATSHGRDLFEEIFANG